MQVFRKAATEGNVLVDMVVSIDLDAKEALPDYVQNTIESQIQSYGKLAACQVANILTTYGLHQIMLKATVGKKN